MAKKRLSLRSCCSTRERVKTSGEGEYDKEVDEVLMSALVEASNCVLQDYGK